MKKPVLVKIFALAVALLLCFSLAACGNSNRGMPIQEQPHEVFKEFVNLYFNDGDYTQLCSSSLKQAEIDKAMEFVKDKHYFLVEDGNSLYETVHGKEPKLDKNDTIYGVYLGESAQLLGIFSSQGYVIITKNSNGNYYIKDIGFVPV